MISPADLNVWSTYFYLILLLLLALVCRNKIMALQKHVTDEKLTNVHVASWLTFRLLVYH